MNSFTIRFNEIKSDQYLAKVAGWLLSQKAIREVKKSTDNTMLICTITSHEEVDYVKVEENASAAGHTLTKD